MVVPSWPLEIVFNAVCVRLGITVAYANCGTTIQRRAYIIVMIVEYVESGKGLVKISIIARYFLSVSIRRQDCTKKQDRHAAYAYQYQFEIRIVVLSVQLTAIVQYVANICLPHREQWYSCVVVTVFTNDATMSI